MGVFTFIGSSDPANLPAVAGSDAHLFRNTNDDGRLYVQDASSTYPVDGSDRIMEPRLQLPENNLTASDVGKFVMPDGSGGAEPYSRTTAARREAALVQRVDLGGNSNFQDGDTLALTYPDGSDSTLTYRSSVSNSDSEVAIGADLAASLSNLQSQLDTASSVMHEVELLAYTVLSGTNGFDAHLQVRAGQGYNGAAGNDMQLVWPITPRSTLFGSGHNAISCPWRPVLGQLDELRGGTAFIARPPVFSAEVASKVWPGEYLVAEDGGARLKPIDYHDWLTYRAAGLYPQALALAGVALQEINGGSSGYVERAAPGRQL